MDILEIFYAYMWYFYAAYIMCFLGLILYFMLHNRGKIMIRVKSPLQEQVLWAKPAHDGKTVVVRKAKGRNEPGWHFTFTQKALIRKKSWFGLKSFYALDVFPEDNKAIEYEYDQKEELRPRLTRKDARAINFLEGFKARYRDIGKAGSTNAILIVIAIIGVVGIILQILFSRGLRF